MSVAPARLLFAMLLILPPASALAQTPPPAPPAAEETQAKRVPHPPETQLSVNVVVAKFDGERKVSSVPYMLSVVANGPVPTRVRMGSEIPVTMGPGDGTAVNYRAVGLNIDAFAKSSGKDQFRLDLTIEDSSVAAGAPDGKPADRPVFRTFKANESVLLRDGQSTEFTAATDKLTGEVTKITVALTVQK